MADRSKSFPGSDAMLESFLKTFDGGALAAIQQRNMEAFARTSGIIATAATKIAERQLDLLKSASEAGSASASSASGSSFPDILASQMAAGRDNLQNSLRQMSEMSDAVRQCCADVADELQCCARDNWRSMRGQAEETSPPTVAQPRRAAAG